MSFNVNGGFIDVAFFMKAAYQTNASQNVLSDYTVATLPASAADGTIILVTDANNGGATTGTIAVYNSGWIDVRTGVAPST